VVPENPHESAVTGGFLLPGDCPDFASLPILDTDQGDFCMTELKTKHPGEPALLFLRDRSIYARLDAAMDSGEINEVLESAKHLAGLIIPSENATYWRKEFEVQPLDISALRTLTQIDEDRLDAEGKKALKALIKALLEPALTVAGEQFNGQPSPKIPADSMYYGLDQSQAHVTAGEPAEFGVYPKEQRHTSVVSEYSRANKDCWIIKAPHDYVRKLPELKRPISSYDLQGLAFDAVSGDFTIFTNKPVQAIMGLKNAFAEVSKKEFATAYLKAAEQPAALGIFAFTALSARSALMPSGEDRTKLLVGLSDRLWNMPTTSYRGDFALSAKEFTVNEFAANPLTVKEIKALPFLLGLHKEVYAEVDHDHAIHAESCSAKLRSAGYEFAADFIADFALENQEEEVIKPKHKHDTDLSPGM
jgi:hypothetical protein